MIAVTIDEAQANLEHLVHGLVSGTEDEVVIVIDGEPVVCIIAAPKAV